MEAELCNILSGPASNTRNLFYAARNGRKMRLSFLRTVVHRIGAGVTVAEMMRREDKYSSPTSRRVTINLTIRTIPTQNNMVIRACITFFTCGI